jgi:N6-adenosine-specific RNA methylase IME4
VSAPVLRDALHDDRNVGDAAAPDADCHAIARPKPRREVAVFELVARLCADIAKAEVREILANDEQAGWKHHASSGRLTLSFISNQ